VIENEKKQAVERFAAMNVFRTQKQKSQAKNLTDKASLWRVAQEKMGAWVQHVQMTAKERRTQLTQDLSTIHTLILTDWKEQAGDMLRERGIWGIADEPDKRWKLGSLLLLQCTNSRLISNRL
jgi:hypothetical protein